MTTLPQKRGFSTPKKSHVRKNVVKNVCVCLFCVAMMISIATNPAYFGKAAFEGLSVFAKSVFPCLFPFMIFSSMLFSFDGDPPFSRFFEKPMKAFGLHGKHAMVIIVGLMAGNPVGAKTIAEQRETRKITKNLMNVCISTSPIFILGAMGESLFHNHTFAIIVFFSTITAALLNGMIFSNLKINQTPTVLKKESISFADVVENACASCLKVCAYIVFFFIITAELDAIFSAMNIFQQSSNTVATVFKSLLFGGLEITRGMVELSKSGLCMLAKCVIAAAVVSFGGFSVGLQNMSHLKSQNISWRQYLFSRLTHALLASGVALVFGLIFML